VWWTFSRWLYNITPVLGYTIHNFNNFDPSRETYQNTLVFDGDELVETYNMGGCMGCHGAAQETGTDFSFILEGGRVAAPEHPDVPNPGDTNSLPVVNQFKTLEEILEDYQ